MPNVIATTGNVSAVAMFTLPSNPGRMYIGVVYANGAFSVWRKGSAKYIRGMWKRGNFSPAHNG